MISHSEQEVFTEREIQLWKMATEMVVKVVEPEGVTVRCHELARAVGIVLGLPYSDGMLGSIEHTWLRVGDWATDIHDAKILDVYVPGGHPQVQLIHYGSWSIPIRTLYRQGVEYERHDINEKLVAELVRQISQ